MPAEAARSGYVYAVEKYPAVVAAGTSAEEYLTDLIPGFPRRLYRVRARVVIAGAGAGATRTFRVVKGASTVVASGTIALAATTLGAVINIPITSLADATWNELDTLTIDVAGGGTSFTTLRLEFQLIWQVRAQQQGRPREATRAGWVRQLEVYDALVATGTASDIYVGSPQVENYARTIESVKAVVVVPGAGAAATRLLNVRKIIPPNIFTGFGQNVTLAATATKGAVIDIPPVTGYDPVLQDGDTMQILMQAGGTQFTTLELAVVVQTRHRAQQI